MPLPTAQDPSSRIAGGEFTPTEAAAAIAGDDDRVTATDYRDPKKVAKEQRERGFRRASGGISRGSAGVKLSGGKLYYQDAASVGNFLKGIRYGVVKLNEDHPSYGKKGEMAQLLMDGTGDPSKPWGLMETLKPKWEERLKLLGGTNMAWPTGLGAIEGDENWGFASHIISKLGKERYGEIERGLGSTFAGGADLALAREDYLKKKLEQFTSWDSEGWRAPLGQRVPKGGVVGKPESWMMSGEMAGQVGPRGEGMPTVANPQEWFRFVSEDGKTWILRVQPLVLMTQTF
jgi:hypothetical protein